MEQLLVWMAVLFLLAVSYLSIRAVQLGRGGR
jgi:hypothetical protein